MYFNTPLNDLNTSLSVKVIEFSIKNRVNSIPTPWTPASLPNLALFHKYDEAANYTPTATVDQPVSQADAQEGTSRTGTASGAQRPIFRADGLDFGTEGTRWLDMSTLTLTGDFVAYCVVVTAVSELNTSSPSPLGHSTGFAQIGTYDASCEDTGEGVPVYYVLLGISALNDASAGPSVNVNPPVGGLLTFVVRRSGEDVYIESVYGDSSTTISPLDPLTLDMIGKTGLGQFNWMDGGRLNLTSVCSSYFAKDSADDLAMRAWLVAQG